MIKLSLTGGCARDNMRKVWTFLIAITLTITVIPIIIDIAPPAEAPTIYVDDDNTGPENGSPGNPYNTIQEAVDAAQPGDTVFVSNGTYYEDVYINKTINLTGISRDNTTINSTNVMGIFVENADYVNITGFTVENGSWTGIRLIQSNYSLIENNRVENNNYGIEIAYSNNTLVKNNIVLSSFSVGIEVYKSSNNYIYNNTSSNEGHGIRLFTDSKNNTVSENQVISNMRGIILTVRSDENIIRDNIIEANTQYGIRVSNSNENLLINNSLSNNQVGVRFSTTNGTNMFVNSSIASCIDNDVEAGFDSNDIFLNTSFNKTKSYFYDSISLIRVQWYLHVNVTDYFGNPVPNVKVNIEDNLNGSYNQIFITDSSGFVKWLPITEYIEQDMTGDTIGEKIYYTPHRIVAWNDTLVGYAQPIMDKSRTITIVLYNGTLIDLEPGWNLISLPRILSDTNLQIILQSIEECYDSVYWYNVTDKNDHWKHHHISKPSHTNDLDKLNHTIGFWLHITDLQGTTLVVFGEELIADQNILLYQGWNLVGYPSKSNKTRDVALDNLFYGTDVDSIWTYNATIQKWVELDDTGDYFEVGQGYWVHSKVTDVWNVPL
jgi:parallel beta-helix repeat protein